ncbi:GGDEF domain-containing protein [Anaerosinus massiliensis]|uniref:GGDEF domain-containing protein n=1 Tax=Massilibacillus massiliensis TaxID=1806837 RepID=UPI0018FEF421|nr:GGDEF domain-containing protein [Massilibacillus massiliensis]
MSFWQAVISFLLLEISLFVFFSLNQIPSKGFLIFTLSNLGVFLISCSTSRFFIQSTIANIKRINQLKIEVATDSLTQLLNRNGLEQALKIVWACQKRDNKRVGILMIDIDYFKSYNDALGHLEGDCILQQVAGRIKGCCKRETDIVGRIGSEEFLIFLSDLEDTAILNMAQQISAAIANLKIKAVKDNGPFEFLSVSIGVATRIPQNQDLVIDLYKQADKALYHAKRSGRNCISFQGKITQHSTQQISKCSLYDTVQYHESNN